MDFSKLKGLQVITYTIKLVALVTPGLTDLINNGDTLFYNLDVAHILLMSLAGSAPLFTVCLIILVFTPDVNLIKISQRKPTTTGHRFAIDRWHARFAQVGFLTLLFPYNWLS